MNVLISTLKKELAAVKRVERNCLDGLGKLPNDNFIVRQVRGGKNLYANKRAGPRIVQLYVGKATEARVKECVDINAKKWSIRRS